MMALRMKPDHCLRLSAPLSRPGHIHQSPLIGGAFGLHLIFSSYLPPLMEPRPTNCHPELDLCSKLLSATVPYLILTSFGFLIWAMSGLLFSSFFPLVLLLVKHLWHASIYLYHTWQGLGPIELFYLGLLIAFIILFHRPALRSLYELCRKEKKQKQNKSTYF